MSTIMGNRIKELRNKADLTQDELAKQLNDHFGLSINKSMISKWENGKGDPYLSYAKYLSLLFGVNLDYLVGLTDEPKGITIHDGSRTENVNMNSEFLASYEQALIGSFRQLNPEGQEKAVEYVGDLVASGRYIKSGPDGMVEAE